MSMLQPTIVIHDFPHPSASGLGVTFNFVVWQMLRHRDRQCYVNIDKSNNPYRCERGPNPWDYYFDQTPMTGYSEDAGIEDPLDLALSGHRDWTVERSAAASRFARSRIRLLPHIQAEIDSFVRQHFKGRVLAVAVRGTDKPEEYRPMKEGDIVARIREIKAATKADTVFLMTDDVRYHEIITAAVGAVSITMPRSRKSLHHNPPQGPYMSGLWMVMDGFIAAYADDFAYTPSNAATIPLIMGRFQSIHRINRHCVIEPFCSRVDGLLL